MERSKLKGKMEHFLKLYLKPNPKDQANIPITKVLL